MLKKIAKLIDVKSLVTLALTATFIVLSLKGTITADNFMSIFTVIIAFYFGTQVGKKEAKEETEENT
jgi:amino acid permease